MRSLLVVNSLAITSGLLSIVSVYMQSIAPFLVARFLNGIMCGMFGCIATIYLTEMAPRHTRGAIGTLHQLALVIGILMTNICGLPQILGTFALWPYLYAATGMPILFHICFLPFCMETPKYTYINRNDPVEAEKSKIIIIVKRYYVL